MQNGGSRAPLQQVLEMDDPVEIVFVKNGLLQFAGIDQRRSNAGQRGDPQCGDNRSC